MKPPSTTGMRAAALLIALFSVGFFFIRLAPYAARPTGGFIAYYTSGAMLLRGSEMGALYDDHQFVKNTLAITGLESEDYFRSNPPTLAFLMAPFSSLPIAQAKLLWEIFSLACIVAGIFLFITLFALTPIESLVFSAFAFGFSPLYANFVWGQVYAPLLLLHILLMKFWMEKKELLSAIAIVLLLLLKGYGLMFLFVAIFQKQWKVVAYSIVIYAASIAVSSAAIGFETWTAYAASLLKLITSLAPAATFQQNIQSLVSWVFVQDRWNSHPILLMPGIAGPLVLVLVTGGVFILYRFAVWAGSVNSPLPLAAAVIVGVLTAPILFDYHYTLILPSIVIAYRYFPSPARAFDYILFGLSLLLLTPKIPYHTSFFQDSWIGILGFPRIHGSILLLWLLARTLSSRKELDPTIQSPLWMPPAAGAK